MLNVKDIISINPEILLSQPVFKGTRGAIESLFDYWESGENMDSFLADFPTVTKIQAIAVMEIASKLLTSKDILKIYEAAA